MLKRTVLILPLLALAMLSGTGFAQTPEAPKTKNAEPSKSYKLEFVVKEVEGGKVLNARSYSMLADLGRESAHSIRTGSKVPILATKNGPEYQYLDIGVFIDCKRPGEVQGGLSLTVSVDISSVLSEPAATTTTGMSYVPPTIRVSKWESVVIVPLKKPTVLFSSDDPTSKRQMQLELTATPIL